MTSTSSRSPILTDETLSLFWQTATEPVPLAIIGGGRWGRTWARVASTARGTGGGLILVARSNADDTRAWARGESGLDQIEIHDSLDAAMVSRSAPVAAIVATRPRDHAADAMAAMRHGLDVLVEKPLTAVAADGEALIAAAARLRRLLAVGTEFAFLPAFHVCARLIRSWDAIGTVRLTWDDPAGEVRHGDAKRLHDEIGILADLAPHACSIFRIFADQAPLRVSGFQENRESEAGTLTLSDRNGASYELRCDKRADRRRRILELKSRGSSASVNFGGTRPEIVLDGVNRNDPSPDRWNSTLRLELGAFLAERAGIVGPTPISDSVADLLAIQSAIESGSASAIEW